MKTLYSRYLLYLPILGLCLIGRADVKLPSIFGDHMVLQREQVNPVWGVADAGEVVTVEIAEQSHETTAGADGKWRVKLEPLDVGGPYTLNIRGKNVVSLKDVLVGEVWFCSGQSNMAFPVRNINHAEVELAAAENPQIRLITVSRNITQVLQDDFEGAWQLATEKSVADFSAIGYLYAKRLQSALNVPIGLIDNSVGGSSAESWVPRDILENAGIFTEYIKMWDERCAAYTDEVHAAKVAEYKAWEAAGKPAPKHKYPFDIRKHQNRPGVIYNGMVNPLTGYGIRGVIWYQGESNVMRAAQYRELFPLVISNWRELWQQGDFSFYWVQLADFGKEREATNNNTWSELREAQTMTLSLPNTGQAVIIDAGEGCDIHPRDKQTVADRLVRHALVKDYGYDMISDSPTFATMEIEENAIILTFNSVSKEGLRAFDITEVKGFSVAGKDNKFVWADAKIVGKNQVKVSSELVINPVAARYAWSMNPVVNLQDRNGLPVTPFRTDSDTIFTAIPRR